MNDPESQPTPPLRPPFQFSLRTLLLLFVVLASSLGVFGAWGIVVFVITLGFTLYLREAESLRPVVYLVLVALCLTCLIGLLWPAVQNARAAGRRAACLCKMKQVVLALQNYQQANGYFPPAYLANKNGKPVHSCAYS